MNGNEAHHIQLDKFNPRWYQVPILDAIENDILCIPRIQSS